MKRKPYTVGFIFARGGSKGIPNKNIRLLAGKPLIAYSIETARKSSLIDRVVVSTDSTEIADTARRFGAEVPFIRPGELAGDNTPEILAWRHALQTLRELDGRNVDVLVSIPTTSPLRSVEDIDQCIRLFLESEADAVITIRNAGRHPSFNMFTLDEEGWAGLVMPLGKAIGRRQDAPKVYDMTTVAYVARPEFVMQTESILNGRIKAMIVPEERAVDIDTELDFCFAEFILKSGKQGQAGVGK
jgi:N-acylneuraminate cytidylyltransferase